MQRLKQAIEAEDLFSASLLVAKTFCSDLSEDCYRARVDALTESVRTELNEQLCQEQRFLQLVRVFYRQLAFSGNEKDFFASRYSLLHQVIDYRTGIPVTLAILFCHIAKKLGFDVHGVNFPGHFLLRFQVSADRALFFDPLNGNMLSWPELEALYFSILGDLDEDEMPEDALEAAGAEETVVRLLNNLKASFIKEEKYNQALATTDLLVSLNPDDPYERRDRGFLLHQLECEQLAMDDYQFFIKKCPQDPSAQILKMQLRKLVAHKPDRLH